MKPIMSTLQILAFLGGIIGFGANIGATVSNEWKITSRASSVITATWVFQGLWMNCAGNAIGAVHCRRHHTIFKLESYIQVCRGLMIASVCLGFFGAILALVGMKCTKIGGSDKTKARIACLAGLNFIIGGLSSLTACSLYAHRITSEFFDPAFIAQKYELGAALFIGWAGSVLSILGGVVFCFSLAEEGTHARTGYTYSGASFISSRTKAQNRAGDLKSSRENGFSAKQFGKNAYV
ncbi:claudin-10 isoform X1 [Lepisosteus oculatus]|uniref:claudin-10 isoform X1 n=1 Tax=Lepisosteus oculatus TaxID=7918 RepID=UPI00073FAB67|nr:PREDICTED: claudin-10 isoform X1 [Lepisosteus oculatus]